MLRTARPSAPPIRREVFSKPEASPLCSRGTPDTAAIVAGTSVSPSPSAESTPPGSTEAA
ncbi:MAG TPA: hypothetical protein VMB05_14485 [Solirubrobacteraceae bacterium]|nr:hypothetical protein [Solirubrobacteraceae bacterium]